MSQGILESVIEIQRAEHDGCLLGQAVLDVVSETGPGPQTSAALSMLDPVTLGDAQKIELAHAWERQIAWTTARQVETLASLHSDDTTLDDTTLDDTTLDDTDIAIELATTLGVSEFASRRQLETARALDSRLAQTQELLSTGRWTLQHVGVMVDETAELTDEQAAWVEEQVIELWRKGSVRTPAQVRNRAKRAAMAADADRAEQLQTMADKRVEAAQFPDGHGLVAVETRLAAADAQIVWKALTARGRKLRERAKQAADVMERHDLAFWRSRTRRHGRPDAS